MELTGRSSYECKLCGGHGSTRVDEGETQQCICKYTRALKAHLGPEIVAAPSLEGNNSPLFVQAEKPGEAPPVDKTVNNLIIRGWWHDILPHIKRALVGKGTRFFTRIVTDEKLKNVWLGNEKYNSRSRKSRDDEVAYNSLGDLIGEDYNLLIIRLGCLDYKNAAMPGILKEALIIRQVSLLPTWLIEEPSNPFVPGHYSYSDDVAAYLAHNQFEVIKIAETKDSQKTPPASIKASVDEDGNLSMGVEQPEKPDFVPPRQAPTREMDMTGFDSGSNNRKKFGNKKRFGGGDPLG